MTTLHAIPGIFPCPHCSQHVFVTDFAPGRYFNGITENCSHCGQVLDWWSIVLSAVKDNFMFYAALQVVGATVNITSCSVEKSKPTTISFEELGLPSDAHLLDFDYTGEGVWILEAVVDRLHRFGLPKSVHILALPPEFYGGEPTESSAGRVNFKFVWVRDTENDVAWANLVNAYQAYATRRFTDIIIPANVSVEAHLGRLLTSILAGVAGKKKVEEFLTSAATYSHQLNVLLPALLLRTNIPRLPPHILGHLNHLRSMRNDLAHQGHTTNMDQEQAAQLLCAALFGFSYVTFVEAELGKLT